MDMNDLAKSLFNSKRAEGSSSVSNTKTIQGTVTEDSQDGRVKVVIDGDCVTADGTNEVEIGTVASLEEGDETIILLEGGGVMRPTALGAVGWGDKAAKTATAYITEIDNAGITVHPSGSTTDYAQINANGMDVVKNSTSVAQFGDTARIGTAAGQNIKIDSDSIDICSGSTVDATFTANKIELARNSSSAEIEMLAGNASINAKPIYNGPSSQVYFGLESYETKVVGTNTARVSYQGERHLGDGEKSTFSDVYVSRGGVQLTTNSMYLEEDGTASSGSVSSGYIGVSSGNALFSLGTIVMHAGTDGDTSSDTGYVFSNGHGIEPVLLFANENVPMSGSINLSETAANFERLDIMYKNNDGEYDSLTVWNPNGKKVALSSMHAASGGGSIYYKAKTVLISGTVINTASDSSSYFTAQHYTQGNGGVGGSFGDYVNVSHVFGYRKAPLT